MGYAAHAAETLVQISDESPPRFSESPSSGIALRKTPTRTANLLVDVLAKAGVEVIFGLPGGPVAPIMDALLDRPEITTITTRHEAGAMFAAAGYAQATGKVAVVVVTSGPGILNAMTGIASAHCEGLPVVVIAGDVPRDRVGKGAAQDGTSHGLDIIHMAKPITKMAAEVIDSTTAPGLLRRALATAASGRPGPVVLTIPIDVSTAKATPPVVEVNTKETYEPPAESLDAVAGALMSARRGLILVGSGARWGNGPELVRQLAERLQIPVMTTPKGKGVLPDTHPLSLGVFGWGGHASATEYLERGVDVLFAIGTSLGEHASDSWSTKLAASEHFIHLDVDPSRIGRNYPVSLGLVDTVEGAIPKLLQRMQGMPRRLPMKHGVRRANTGDQVLVGKEGKIAPQRALWELQQAVPADTLYTSDIGAHMFFALHHIEARSPRGFMITLALGSMGSGIGAAFGMKVARPEAPVVSICGDGCFSMALGDIATAAQNDVPMIVAVLNDERYGMVEIGHDAIYGRTPKFSMPMDIKQLAEGAGAKCIVIDAPDQLKDLDLVALAGNKPLVLDIRIDPTIHLSPSRLEFLKKAASSSQGAAPPAPRSQP
ncbi:MAG: thiamine pyrophosphate-binding protein [Labilithrix sp.]|nr:thiamine pyrophosphate-binding protein [Labilithrix sp.]MCW5810943.1 thiamine pyrophosphate-binding protein [Labilithrix sp.]